MQAVSNAWTVEEVDSVRKIAHNFRVSWKKESLIGNQSFRIGASSIGGDDVIGINPGAIGGPGLYKYFDESAYVQELAWERGFAVPTGGLTKALAEARLVNNSEVDYGQSILLDGSGDYANFTRQTFSGEFTFAVRFKNTDPSGTSFVLSDSSTDIKFGFSSNKLFARVLLGGSSDNTITLADMDWHHLVFTRDSNNKVDVYIDGGSAQRLFSDAAQSGTCALAYIGRSSTGQYFTGYIDDVMVWNSKLSDSQIAGLHNNRSIQPNATVIYGFDGVSTDASGNGIDATLNGDAAYSTVVSQEFSVGVKSGRFTPEYMGGNSELFTAILPRRPAIINAGFNFEGIDQTIPQFSGIFNKPPQIDIRNRLTSLSMADYVDFFRGRYLDHTIMFTSQRSDVVIENALLNMGMATAQYELDTGINIINFGLFEAGTKFSDLIQEVVYAENGQFYQDEEGIFRFENRHHWNSSPHDTVQRVILTSQVLNAEAPSEDHIINAVEVKGEPRAKESAQPVWQAKGYAGAVGDLIASGSIELAPDTDTEVWASFNDPVLAVDEPVANGTASQTSYFAANTESDASGTDMTSSVYLKAMDTFAEASRMVFHNNTSSTLYLVDVLLVGRPARRTGDIYYRETYESSITAYEERLLTIDSRFIQSQSWAQSYAGMILQDFSQPENLQKISISAIPELQLGDLISWQGRYWRIYDIKAKLNPSVGFVQELTMLQRDIIVYFQIGVSSVGSTDAIAA